VKHPVRQYYLVLILIGSIYGWAATACATTTKPQILLLNSYHQGLSWTDNITRAVQQELADYPVELSVEYLDSKRRPLSDVWSPMRDYLAQKYTSANFAAIIVSDNNALQFINSEREQLFPQVPVIFCGINFFQPPMINSLRPQVTGVKEEIAPLETVRLMQKLQPELKRLIVVSDLSETSRANLETCRQQFKLLNETLKIDWWHGLASNDLLGRLAQLNPRNDGVLLLSFTHDADGHYLSFAEQGQQLSTAAKAPMYGLWDFYLGTGILGGSVISAPEQGKLAAGLCRQILQGRSANEIPIQRHLSGRFIVDSRALQRFDIPLHWLPKETTQLFQPHSFYTMHKRESWLAISIFLLLSILSLSLAISKKQQARTTRELRAGEARLRTVLNSITDAVLAIDKRGLLIGLNPVAEKLLSCAPLEYVGQRLDSFFVVVDTITRAPLPCLEKQAMLQTQQVQFPEHSTLITSNNQEYQIAGSISSLRDDDGIEIGTVLALRDISVDYTLRQQLRQQKRRFKVVTNSLNDVLILIDNQLRIQLMNAAGISTYQIDPDNYIGHFCHELFWNCSTPCVNCPSLQVMQDGKTAHAMRFRDNGQILDRTIYPVYDEFNNMIGTTVVASDITERYHAEQALLNSRQQLLDVANSMPGAIFQFSSKSDGSNEISYMAESIRILAGLDASADIFSLNVLLGAMLATDRKRIIKATMRAIRHKAVWDEEFRFATAKGEKWTHGRAYPRQEDGTIIFNGVLTDITMRKDAEAKLEHQASHDHLTGLANAALYRDRLQQALVRAHRHGEMLAVVMLDLDRFKDINDSLGHAAGDHLLQQVALRLQHNLRRDDTVARFGGDEFLLLVEGLHCADNLIAVLEKMMLSFNEPFLIEGHELSIATSVGVATHLDGDDDVDSLIKNADTAMYRAKKTGGQHYCFYAEEMSELAISRLTLERDLRKALEKNELQLHYQPKVELATGELIALEALIRWTHPQRGMVPPDVFIPLAETSNLILSIGEWVIKEACNQLSRWRQQKLYTGRIAVNISAVQIKRGQLVETVHSALKESGLEANSLSLEITETSIMELNDEVLHKLNQLRELGVSLAVDDFGTGYSSLSYLKQLPIDTLKLDKSFVDDLPENEESVAITHAIIAMAHALQLRVVAEGVENTAQYEFLLRAGADLAQGYLWARPQAQPDFAAFPMHIAMGK
jgi:diguanylate cyclase (GGDEF)-like protein/PAS domain S-box-containing protein